MYESQEEHDHYEGAMEQGMPQEEPTHNTREQCDCGKYPEQQEVGGHGRYCEHYKKIEEHEMTPFESQLAQAILGALEYRGFYDCGKYLDTSLIEHIRPPLHQELQKAREEERERIIYVTKNIKDAFMSPLTERRWLQCIQFTDQPKPEEQSELDQPITNEDNLK